VTVFDLLPLLFGKLPPRFAWTFHNVVAHPASELLYQLGYERLSVRVHDLTVPDPEPFRD
jgi:hypothetical protein